MAISRFSIVRTAILPGIVPRLAKTLFTGYAPLTLAMAQAFAALRLLPRGHAYLLAENYGKFTARGVLAEARRHLVVDRTHADQVILYYTLLIGFFCAVAEAVTGAVLLAVRHAHAADDVGATYSNYFVTPEPAQDIAFNIFDLMFGFTGIFGSNSLSRVTSVQTGLQALFHFYNLGILAVAAIILLYTITSVIAETSESGVPFGQRFNGAWAPLRLIFAVGLLTPLTFGMNGGQLMTMYIAKWGSSLATNGWITFLDNLNGATQLGDSSSLVIDPGIPDVRGMTEALFVAKTCAQYQCLAYGKSIQGYVINGTSSCPYLKTTNKCTPAGSSDCDSVTVNAPQAAAGGTGTGNGATQTTISDVDNFDHAQQYSNHRSIYIRFGEKNSQLTTKAGGVAQLCGDMTIDVKDTVQPGADYVQRKWYDLLNELWKRQDFDTTALNIVKSHVPSVDRDPGVQVPSTGGTVQEFLAGLQTFTQSYETDAIKAARQEQIAQGNWNEDFTKYGWMGAGMWYNKLAEMNGALMAAVGNPPYGKLHPAVLEDISSQKQEANPAENPALMYRPYESGDNAIEFAEPEDKYEAIVEYEAQQMFESGYQQTKNNGILDMISAIFGTGNLFSMQQNIKDGINPLVQLIGLGRGMMEASVRNMGIAFGGAILGGIGSMIGSVPASAAGTAISGMASRIGMLGLAVGVALFYVLPFLPFLYFFFAATTWFKSVFVALVSIPLWAIAHMRIDGEGLPGRSAMEGYFLLLEILIRPILMVIGLIGGFAIFVAQASILSEIWDLVTVNLTGFDRSGAAGAGAGPAATGTNYGTTTGMPMTSMRGMRGVIDQFMMTIIFTVVIYMMAVSSFKLTDAIPDSVLRWMRASGFGLRDQNPAEGLMSRLSEGALLLIDPQKGALAGLIGRNG